MFKKYGTCKPEISDHRMIYEEQTEKVRKSQTKMITFRQTKYTDFEELNRDLSDTPWPVGDIFGNSSEISMTTRWHYLNQLWTNTHP